jgi:hypothetical protein
MSILTILAGHVHAGVLEQLQPLDGGPALRRLVLTPDVARQLDPATADEDLAPGAGRLRAWCDRYLRGATLVVGSGRHRTADLKILDPMRDEVWEIRKQDSPSTRVFGRFASRDVYVGTNIATSSYLFSIEWLVRGVLKLPIWLREIRNCKARWRALFHPYPPVTNGASLHDYITRAIDER